MSFKKRVKIKVSFSSKDNIVTGEEEKKIWQ